MSRFGAVGHALMLVAMAGLAEPASAREVAELLHPLFRDHAVPARPAIAVWGTQGPSRFP